MSLTANDRKQLDQAKLDAAIAELPLDRDASFLYRQQKEIVQSQSGSGGSGSGGGGEIIPATTLITAAKPAQLVAIRPDSVVNTNTKFLEFEIITLRNVVATQNHRGELPAANDPRWVDITREEVIRGFNVYLYDYIIKNSICASGCLDFNIYIKDSQRVERAYRVSLAPGNLSIPYVVGFSKPPSLDFSILIEMIQLNPNIANSNLVVEDGKLKVAISSQAVYALSVPTKVRFDFSRQGVFTQAVIAGAMGFIQAFSPTTDQLTFDWGGYTPVNGQKVRVLCAPDSTYLPPCGITYVADATDINQLNSSFVVKGSIPPVLGKLMRLRLLTGTLGGQSNSATVSFLTSTQETANTWRVTIGNSSGTKIIMTDRGSNRWFYLGYVESPDLFWLSPNQLSLNGSNPLDLLDELTGDCTITTGTPTVMTAANHGLVVGDKLTITTTVAGTYPAPVTNQNRTVFVSEVLTANTFRVSAINGGLPIILTSAGSGVSVIKSDGTNISVVVTVGTAGSIGIANHGMIVGARLRLGGATLPGGYTDGLSICASAVTNNTITPCANPGGFVCAFNSAGSGVTVSGTNASFNQAAISLDQYTLDDGGTTGVFNLKDSTGTVLNLTSASQNVILSAVEPAQMSITAVVAPYV